MIFQTHGPFQLGEMSPVAIDELYEEIENTRSGLQNAIGVYIIAARGENSRLVPWYVGKTNKKFGVRLKQHFDSGRFHQLATKGQLCLFLIARITQKGKIDTFRSAERRKRGLNSVKLLEESLIGACLAKNPNLLNAQIAAYLRKFRVPGFLNDTPEDKTNKSAKELARMLRARK